MPQILGLLCNILNGILCLLSVCHDEEGLLLHFPFDEHLNDVTCNRIPADEYGDVQLSDDAILGKSAYFDGRRFLAFTKISLDFDFVARDRFQDLSSSIQCSNSLLLVNYMTNIFNRVSMDRFTVALWFKTDGPQQGIGGLVNNGHCYTPPSFDVHVGSGTVSTGSLDTEDSDNKQLAEFTVLLQLDEQISFLLTFAVMCSCCDTLVSCLFLQVSDNVWMHVAMVYDGQQLVFYVDGIEQSPSEPLTGIYGNAASL